MAKVSTQAVSQKPQLRDAERQNFRALLLANPNHFGNLVGSALQPALNVVGDTTYEKIRCLGFQPQLSQLEAVVYVNQSSGYMGGICTAASREFVRFYLSFDNGATWQDQGLTSLQVFDVEGKKPLEYAVTLRINPRKRWCSTENLPLARGILSWNNPPPANTPNFAPVWGNVVDSRIQIAPGPFIILHELLAESKLKLPDEFAGSLDLSQELSAMEPQTANLSELKAQYKAARVPDHRLLFPTIQQHAHAAAVTTGIAGLGNNPFEGLGIDLTSVIEAISKTDGDVGFEELVCVGLDTARDALTAVLKVKRSAGYGGGLCTKGSQEFVAFWIDWGSGWQWAGTAAVNVHDIKKITPDGLEYAVFQPINVANHRRPCGEGPALANVRAILSWAVAPPPTNPNYKPTWGNRLETHVHVYPGNKTKTGDYTSYIEAICSVPACDIDQSTGFAPHESPFGGTLRIFGTIPGAPSVLTATANRPHYRVSVRQLGTLAWQHLTDSFGISIDEQLGAGPVTHSTMTQTVDANDFYTYQEAPPQPGIGWRNVVPFGLLAEWSTGSKTGKWEIMIESRDPVSNAPFTAGSIFCNADGSVRQSVIVDLDNAKPIVGLSITGFTRGGGPLQVATDCGTFKVGDVLHGTYLVADEHLGSLSLSLEPPGGGSFTIDGIATSGRSYPAIPNTGQSGTWTLDTAGLKPCGYVVRLDANDRSIVSCTSNNSDRAFVGFCLTSP